jgi:thioredoxin
MTQQPGPRLDVRGAVDLSALARPGAPGGAPVPAPAGSATGVVREVTDADFQDALELSLTVPVIVDLWAEWCGPCKQLSPVLEKLAVEYGGRFVVAKVDVDANPGLAQAFRAQSIPMVVTLLKGQAVPQLAFTGALPERQVRQFVEQVLQVGPPTGSRDGSRSARTHPRRRSTSRRCPRCTRRRTTPSPATTSTPPWTPTSRRWRRTPPTRTRGRGWRTSS